MNESKIIESYNDVVSEIISLMKELNMGLTSQINNLNHEIKSLREENLKLLVKNAELEAKLNKNSKNSSNHHQLIIIKNLPIVAQRPVGSLVLKKDMWVNLF